jgi:hypothetical protein
VSARVDARQYRDTCRSLARMSSQRGACEIDVNWFELIVEKKEEKRREKESCNATPATVHIQYKHL